MELGDLEKLKDSGATPANDVVATATQPAFASSDDRLWAGYTGRIVKTTEVDVSLTQDGRYVGSRESTATTVGEEGVPSGVVSPPASESESDVAVPEQAHARGIAI